MEGNAMTQDLTHSSSTCRNCPECGAMIIHINHTQVCNQCGLVVDNLHFYPPFFPYGEKYERKETRIHPINDEGTTFSIPFNADNQHIFRRLKHVNRIYNHSLSKSRDTQIRIRKMIYRACNHFQVSNPHRLSQTILLEFTKIQKKREVRNAVTLGITLFYYYARKDHPITVKAILEYFDSFGHRISKQLLIRDIFKYGLETQRLSYSDCLRFLISKYLYSRVCQSRRTQANLTRDQVREYCETPFRIKNTVKKTSRNYPHRLAAAVIYTRLRIARRKHNLPRLVTQEEMAVLAQVPKTAIRDYYNCYIFPNLSPKNQKLLCWSDE
jgi:transcription initiation factor TFIIIB Brf1 subunit/transcription initiation factor TFIIB